MSAFSSFQNIRKGSREPRYLDDEEIRRRDEEQKQEVEEYNRFRDQVKQWRDNDKQNRNQIKLRQLEECEELQVQIFMLYIFTLQYQRSTTDYILE